MSFWIVVGIITSVKFLLIPSYRSTDFEVHRNWLAITHSKPISRWYLEDTSIWTLDYPPFFAYFEWCLSWVAQLFDKDMLSVENQNYASEMTVLFQRLSVTFSDLILVYAVKQYADYSLKQSAKSTERFLTHKAALGVVLLGNCGLLVVDHIHFQYNGFLFGVLLLSLVRICQGRPIEGAFWFAVLLNLKHIFLYIAPAYFIYLLRSCFRTRKDGGAIWSSFSPIKLASLGFVVIMVFGASFGPFLAMHQLPQVISRLFPFKRGLCHAYWAPNFWALYNMADKVITIGGNKLGVISADIGRQASMTGGLVQEFDHVTLLSIKPVVTLLCTLLSIAPALYHLWRYPGGPLALIRCLILCAFGSFMFGWHVHEKAILLVIIPFTLLALEKKSYARIFLLLSTVGHYSLFPLIFTQAETPIKYLLMLMYSTFAFTWMAHLYSWRGPWWKLPLLSVPESIYLWSLIPLEVYCNGLHFALGLDSKLPFLPLLVISVYCSIGVVYCWVKFYWLTFHDKPKTYNKVE